MLIDTHCHVMVSEFNADREAVIERALAAGVSRLIAVGFDAETNAGALKLAAQYDFVYATLGLHPYEADKCDEAVLASWRDEVLRNKKVVALGETGLDYLKSPLAPAVQKASFRAHLELAAELGLPVIVHNRQADEDTFNLLQEFPKVKAVYHCFDADLEYAKKVWAAGYITSFTAIPTYPSAERLREVIRHLPLEQFFVETDCPYLAPQVHRGDRNEPAYLVEIVKLIAEMRGLSFEEVARISTENVERVFKRTKELRS